MIILGGVLTVVAFFASLWILIYGLPILILGIFVLFNKKEDDIEGIKDSCPSKSVRFGREEINLKGGKK